MNKNLMNQILEWNGQTENLWTQSPPDAPEALRARVRIGEGLGRQHPGLLAGMSAHRMKHYALRIGLPLCLATSAAYGNRIESGPMAADIDPLVSYVTLGPQKIFEAEPFYVATKDWHTIATFAGTPTSAGSAVTRRAAPAAPIAGEEVYTLTTNGFRLDQSLEIKPDSRVNIACQGIWLSRPLFEGTRITIDGKTNVLDPVAFKECQNVKRIVIATPAGDWDFTLGADAGNWSLWNTCDRPWGSEERKTFVFVYGAPPTSAQGLKVKLSFDAKFIPKPGWEAKMEARSADIATAKMRQLLLPYGIRVSDEELPRDPVQRAQAMARRLVDSTANLDPSGLDPQAGILIPDPKERSTARGVFAVPAKLDVACAAAHAGAVDVLTAELARFGVRVNRVDPSGSAAVLIGIPSADPAVDAACKRLGLATIAPEGFVLHVTPDRVLIAGTDAQGVIYGAQTLRQLIRAKGQPASWFARQVQSWRGVKLSAAEVPAGTIKDWPDLKVRGFMIEAPHRGTPDEFARLARDFYSYFRANTILYEVRWSAYAWQSHPEIAQGKARAMSDLAAAANTARRYGLRFVPYVNMLGKVEQLLKSHPEIAEDPNWDKKGGHTSYCPSRPETYKLVFDLLNELVEVTKCDAIFSSHDEIGRIGLCPACSNVPPADLFANDVNKIDAFLAGKRVETMIAGDMLLEEARWKPLGEYVANSGIPGPAWGGIITHPAITNIRKDVIILDWHYGPEKRYPTFKYFADQGFRVIGIPWHNDTNNYFMVKGIREIGQLGVISAEFGLWGTRSSSAISMLGVACAWNSRMPEPGQIPWSPLRERIQAATILGDAHPSREIAAVFAPIDLAAAANRPLAGSREAWFGKDGLDLTYLPKGSVHLFGVPYRVDDKGIVVGQETPGGLPARSARVAVNTKARSLVFLHGLSLDKLTVWPQAFGQYTVTYASGESADLAITTQNVTYWRPVVPRENPWTWRGYSHAWDALLAWEGCTKGGEAVVLHAYEWTNPRPDDVIVAVEMNAKQDIPGLAIGLVALTAVQ